MAGGVDCAVAKYYYTPRDTRPGTTAPPRAEWYNVVIRMRLYLRNEIIQNRTAVHTRKHAVLGRAHTHAHTYAAHAHAHAHKSISGS